MSELIKGTTSSLPRLELCTFTLAVALGAVLLLPFSIISNEVLLSLPRNYYIQWLNGSLIHGMWLLVAAWGDDREQKASGRYIQPWTHQSESPYPWIPDHMVSPQWVGPPFLTTLAFLFFL